MSKKAQPKGPIPLNIPPEMRAKLDALKKKSGLSQADIIRLSIERGLGAVERMFEATDKQAA
jgi:predicted DNA-binding protein